MIPMSTRTLKNRGITGIFEILTTWCDPRKQVATNSLRAKSGQESRPLEPRFVMYQDIPDNSAMPARGPEDSTLVVIAGL